MTGQCIDCGCDLGKKNASGRCSGCGNRTTDRVKVGPACIDCGKVISPGATRCQAHANAVRNRSRRMREISRQTMTAKQAAGIARNDAATSAALKLRYLDPVHRAAAAEAAAKGRRNMTAESNRLRAEAQKATRAKQREQRLAWCPAERRDEYDRMRRMLGVAEANRIMQADIATQERRRRAALTPFQRQEEALRRGAPLVTKHKLSREHAFTLGGVASSSL